MNILVTSVGRRVKVIEYFKGTLSKDKGKVICTDCAPNAPALYFGDYYEIVPRIDDAEYITKLKSICHKYKIDAIVSLIDPELEILAEHEKEFEEIDVTLVLSNLNMIQMSFDKYETYKHLTNESIPVVPTYIDIDEVKAALENGEFEFPLISKPRKGSASLGIEIIKDLGHLNQIGQSVIKNNLIIQPFYKDREYGIDVYIDLKDDNLIDLFIKEKVYMRSGETDKSVSVHNDKIVQLVKELVQKTGFRGTIDIDCFEYKGNYFISEINPRFGGGYPHAFEAGCNFVEYIVKNLNGKSNDEFKQYKYNRDNMMMKYDNVLFIEK